MKLSVNRLERGMVARRPRPWLWLMLGVVWLWPWAGVRAQGLEGEIISLVQAANLGKMKFSAAVMDLSDSTIAARINADQPMIPASNAKLVSAAVALSALGTDFTFTTSLAQLDDELILHGSGDPAFADAKLLEAMDMDMEQLLARWVDVVRQAGIEKIRALVVDDRVFDRQFAHPNWPDSQLHLWYCAQVGGLNFNTNCLDIYPQPTRYGQAPIVRYMPIDPPVHIANRARSGQRNDFWVSRKVGTNDITLGGWVKHRYRAPVHVTIHDPPMLLGELLRDRLQAQGIVVDQVRRASNEERFEDARLLAVVRTEMPDILTRALRDSQNIYAEALLKRAGQVTTGEPGSWTNGSATARMVLSRKLGPAGSAIVVDDGSGMSRENRVTAHQLVRLLSHVYEDEQVWPVYRDAMARIYIDEHGRLQRNGTLRRRMTGRKLQGVLYGKSGYLRGVIALSGYLVHDDQAVAFSLLFNDFRKPVHTGKRTLDAIVETIDDWLATHGPQPQLGG